MELRQLVVVVVVVVLIKLLLVVVVVVVRALLRALLYLVRDALDGGVGQLEESKGQVLKGHVRSEGRKNTRTRTRHVRVSTAKKKTHQGQTNPTNRSPLANFKTHLTNSTEPPPFLLPPYSMDTAAGCTVASIASMGCTGFFTSWSAHSWKQGKRHISNSGHQATCKSSFVCSCRLPELKTSTSARDEDKHLCLS